MSNDMKTLPGKSKNKVPARVKIRTRETKDGGAIMSVAFAIPCGKVAFTKK